MNVLEALKKTDLGTSVKCDRCGNQEIADTFSRFIAINTFRYDSGWVFQNDECICPNCAMKEKALKHRKGKEK